MTKSSAQASSDDVIAEAHQWRARLADPLVTKADQQAFDDWMRLDPRHIEAYAESETFWRLLGDADFSGAPERLTLQGRLAGLVDGLRFLNRAPRRMSVSVLGAVAAAVCLTMIVAPRFSAPASAVYETEFAQLSDVTLADGSSVQLGAGSRIEVTITDHVRGVELVRGTAFFDVITDKDRPFTVDVGAATVSVTGTSFDVQRTKQSVRVAVAEGAVIVHHVEAANMGEAADAGDDAASQVSLMAGDGVRVSSAGLGDVTEIAPDDLGGWRDGRLIYNRASLSEIAEDAGRYYNRPIRVYPDIADLTLTGRFRSDDIDGLLAVLDEALPVRIVDLGSSGVAIRAE